MFVAGNEPDSFTIELKPESLATWKSYCTDEPDTGSARNTGVVPQVASAAESLGASPVTTRVSVTEPVSTANGSRKIV